MPSDIYGAYLAGLLEAEETGCVTPIFTENTPAGVTEVKHPMPEKVPPSEGQ